MIFLPNKYSRQCRRALTLVECLFCAMIVGLAMVAAMRAVGASAGALQRAGDHSSARMLAESLMTEILTKSYKDPGALPIFGREAGESPSNRAAWNDVDDFNGYSDSPPSDPTGTKIPGVSGGWKRSVDVAWVTPANLAQVSLIETGLKRITISVQRGPTTIFTLVGYKGDLP